MFLARPEPGPSLPARPAGRLIWLQNSAALARPALDELLRALLADDSTHILLTGPLSGPAQAALPVHCLHIPLGEDDAQAVAMFEHFTPDALLWSGPLGHPRLLARLAQSGIPAALFDMRVDDLQLRRYRRQLGDMLAGFSTAFCVDDRAAGEMRNLGLSGVAIHMFGALAALEAVPSDTSSLRRALSQRLAGRAAWAAIDVCPQSLPLLAAAQVKARRTVPGLVMLAVPQAGQDPQDLLAGLRALGMNAESAQSPGRDLDILVFASADHAATACRIGTAAVLAASFTATGQPPSPLLAANLGAAVLHGPHHGAYGAEFARLGAVRACRSIGDPAELGAALAEVLRPDTAAAMAMAGWTLLSASAEVTTRLAALTQGKVA